MNRLDKEPEEKETECSPEAQPETARRCPVGVAFSRERKSWLPAGFFLLLSGILLALSAPTIWETTAEGVYQVHKVFLMGYAGLTLAGVLLCLLEFRLPELLRRVSGWVLTLLVPWAVFYAVDLINDTKVLYFSQRRLFANYLCYLLVFALVYALCRRASLTTLIGGGACLFFGIANYFVIQFRGKPILPWDIQAIGTAFEVSGGYHYEITRMMAFAVMLLAFLTLLCFRLETRRKKKSWKLQASERGIALVLFAVLAIQIFPCDLLTDMGISVWARPLH